MKRVKTDNDHFATVSRFTGLVLGTPVATNIPKIKHNSMGALTREHRETHSFAKSLQPRSDPVSGSSCLFLRTRRALGALYTALRVSC